ncbi:hypothetical protein CMO89_03365 [Candidatus Woesearchaeota archaeon]|nr:hypothetical protein [Candidatus Woesearchaeota archaeon]|tara:strand:- start:7406 stop:8062 length:657 start_codon:yes stop_codon:yes gene_type:complete
MAENTLQARTKTIKVEVRTWDSLKSIKKENETFNDVIKDLLDERTKTLGSSGIKAVRYKRETIFFISYDFKEEVGFEFEYNDIKNTKSDFVLDLKIKKVFIGKRILNPSKFFGVDNAHKHFSKLFLWIYLKSIALALSKEFRIRFPENDFYFKYEHIAPWRQLYYEYNLSQESFKSDIEEPLELSETEKVSKDWIGKIRKSLSNKYMPLNETVQRGKK